MQEYIRAYELNTSNEEASLLGWHSNSYVVRPLADTVTDTGSCDDVIFLGSAHVIWSRGVFGTLLD